MRLVRPISILTKEYIIGAIYEKVLLDNMPICEEKITLIAVIVQVSDMKHNHPGIPFQVEVKLKTNMKYVEVC